MGLDEGGNSLQKSTTKSGAMSHTKCSPAIFSRLSHAVRAMMAARGRSAVVVYVDDFLIIAPTHAECQEALELLLKLLTQLGFTVSAKKIVLPCQSLTFLGLLLESNVDNAGGMRVTVPEDKLRKAEAIAADMVSRDTVTKQQLQRAVGYFNHLAQAVFSARVYLRRLITALTIPTPNHHSSIPVTRDMRMDFDWWQRYARDHNGTAIIIEKPVPATW